MTAPLNDIDLTGECCCNGCIGEGPCDLEIGYGDDDWDDLDDESGYYVDGDYEW